jgi:hypothetical protein
MEEMSGSLYMIFFSNFETMQKKVSGKFVQFYEITNVLDPYYTEYYSANKKETIFLLLLGIG